MNSPIISIITPSLNRAGMISVAIESVLSQDYPAMEHIIVDGGSTDGTLDVLKRYSHLKVISEPDRGIYDAINKGIIQARGEIIGLLNTDDRYAPAVLMPAAECFLKHPEALAVCGRTSFFNFQGKEVPIPPPLPPITVDSFVERLTTGIPAINSWFFRKVVFEKIGYFNLDYSMASDRDMLLRFACAELPFVSLEKEVIRYGSHPGSMTIYDVWRPAILNENLQLAAHYGDRNDIPVSIRKACQRWERIYSLEIVGHFLRCMDIRSALHYFNHMRHRHWWWLAYFMGAFPLKVVQYSLPRK
jgi:glycosyltransferase involved in cell wall biosynthesis